MNSSKLQEPDPRSIDQVSRDDAPDSSSNKNGIARADGSSTREDSTSQTNTPAFNADDFMTKARARFGGKWSANIRGDVFGQFPEKIGDTKNRYTIRILAISYNDPQGRSTVRDKVERCAIGYRVIGTTNGITALFAWPNENHPVVPWLRETLQLEPVTGPKTRQEFMNESKE